MRQLFDMFGSPAAVERAVRAATPDCTTELGRREHLEKEFKDVSATRQRILDRMVKGLVTDAEADATLMQLKRRESVLRQELSKVSARLAEVADPAQIRQVYVEQSEHRGHGFVDVTDDDLDVVDGGNDLSTYLSMTHEDRKALIQAVFGLPLLDGTPTGVYIRQEGNARAHCRKRWAFTIRGRLDFEYVVPCARH